MSYARIGLLVLALVAMPSLASANEDHAHGAAASEQTLTGEVVDITCHLSHDGGAQGAGHAECAKKCIEGGLPVGLKVGDMIYLAVQGNHQPANAQLASLAGKQVTVNGIVTERDGLHLIAISSVTPQ